MKKIAIIGGGISGLYFANLLNNKKDFEYKIFEKKDNYNFLEGYGIQLSVNSVKLLDSIQFNKLDDDKKFNPDKINFYLKDSSYKICELDISQFNSDNLRYTTLRRSDLIDFLKRDLENLIKTNHSISAIDYQNEIIKLTFENNVTFECDYLIVSDGVFSKCKNIISNNQSQPKYNNTLAIRGIIPNSSNITDKKNISLFLDSNFHHVTYPVNKNGDLNFIAIMKYKLSNSEKKNHSLFNDDGFIDKVLKKLPQETRKFFDEVREIKIFPVFVSDDYFKPKNNNIHFIGDAFFAFPPSFAQGASQSIEGAYELFESIKDNKENYFFKIRVNKTKIVNNRSKFNQFAFHLSNPVMKFLRNFFLRRLVNNKKFLESYLGKIYR